MTDTTPAVRIVPEYTQYRRKQIAELRPYVPGEPPELLYRVSISQADLDAGSPKEGDMIARNPVDHDDQWLVAADYFAANFEPLAAAPVAPGEGEAVQRVEYEIARAANVESVSATIRLDDLRTILAALRARSEPESGAVERISAKTGVSQTVVTAVLNAAHPAPSDPSATERMRVEREDEIVRTATSLFNAFVGGSALRDVQNGTMTKAQADSWKAHAVRQHEQSLREMAGVAALGEA